MADFREALGKTNTGLDRVQIRQKGDRLYLRATLPPKPGDGDKPKQYELSTGYGAHSEGLRFAKAKALEIEGQLLREAFDWTPWLKGKQKPPETVGEWLKRFEENYWESRERSLAKLSTWKTAFQYPFSRLDPDLPLTEELLKTEILKRVPATKSREVFCTAYQSLAKFAGLNTNFRELGIGYKTQIKRDLPTDEEIELMWESIKNPAWKWVFGMLAAYGLRPHEIFHLDCSELSTDPGWLKVLQETKTSERIILPLKADWRCRWQLWDVKMPNITVTGKNNTDLGRKITYGLNLQGLQITSYYLRDAYAVRASVIGIDPTIAAKFMGHGLKIHFDKYLNHINKRSFEDAYNRANAIRPYDR
jgi:integrase